MSQNDLEARQHIEECHVLIDIQRDQIDELQAELRAAKAQIQALLKHQKVDYEVAL